MFENLIESSSKGSKSFGQSVLSLIIHGVIIFAAIEATKGAAEEIKQRVIDTTLVFLKPPEPTPPPPPPPPQDVVVSANPPPKGFQTVVPPDIIPKDIPPVDLSAKPFDPKDFSGKGVEGGISAGIEGGTGPVELGQVFLTSQLDDPAQRISGPPPRLPARDAERWHRGIGGPAVHRGYDGPCRAEFAQGPREDPRRLRGAGQGSRPEGRVQAGAVQG